MASQKEMKIFQPSIFRGEVMLGTQGVRYFFWELLHDFEGSDWQGAEGCKHFRFHLSNEKNLGWLGYIGDYTIQLYRAL